MSISRFVNLVEQGEVQLFSDHEDNGPMWTGYGNRQVTATIEFRNHFEVPPSVSLQPTLFDADTLSAIRYNMNVEDVTKTSFKIVFKTWMDTRFARLSVQWTAFGEAREDAVWDDL